MMLPKVYGYVRLSREDLRGAAVTEEKLQDRARICLELARQHCLPLPEENIVSERATGTSLAIRPGLQRLLELARAGQVTHIITPYQDRITRGNDIDRGTIKEALCAGSVTLITTEGIIPFDRDFGDQHELLYDIKAAVASHFVRDVIKKRKEADLIKLKQGKLSKTSAPYGYYRVTKQDVLAGRFPPEELGSYHHVPEEYAILEEIFQRLKAGEKAPAICEDLTKRNVPPPSSTRPGRRGRRWYASTLYEMIRNPFYIGLLSQRARVGRDHKKKRLKPEEYIYSDVKGDWECPLTDDQFYTFGNSIQGHKERAAPRKGELTGLVFCPNGRPMRIAAASMYGCDCKEHGERHPGSLVAGPRLLGWVQQLITDLVNALPDAFGEWPQEYRPKGRAQLLKDLAQAERELKGKQEQAQDMILRESYFVSLLGRATFEETARKTRAAVEELQQRDAQLKEAADRPDLEAVSTVVQEVKRLGGMERFWQTATAIEQRELIRTVVQRIDMVMPKRRFYTETRATLWDWAGPYAPTPPPFPKVPGTPENLRRYKEEKAKGKS